VRGHLETLRGGPYNSPVEVVAIIPAGGKGKRTGGKIPKQFRSLAGRPLILHTLERIEVCPSVDGVILVVPKGMRARVQKLLRRSSVKKIIAVCEGGQERQDSVSAGLAALPPGIRWVVIHDAVRPFVSPILIEKVISAAKKAGAAVAAIPVRDTVKKVTEKGYAETIDRRGMWLAQTPQAFRTSIIMRAFERASGDRFYGTDDAALVERLGVKVKVVEGEPENMKITEPGDFTLGEAILRKNRRCR